MAHARHRRRKSHDSRALSWVAVLAGAGIALTVGLWLLSDRLLPGTTVAGLALGGLGSSRAETALAHGWRQRTITLRADEDAWSALPAELGLVLDARASIAAARAAGRQPGAFVSTLLRRQALVVDPVWHWNEAGARQFLAELAARVERAPISAGIQVANGVVSTSPARDGRLLDAAATLDALKSQAARIVDEREMRLITQPVPAQVRDVSAAVAAAQALLAQPLTLDAWDPVQDERFSWSIPAQEWGPWLLLADLAPDGTRPSWTVDVAGISAWLDGPAAALGPGRFIQPAEAAAAARAVLNGQAPSAPIRVYHRDSTHVVASGETLASIGERYGIPYPWIQQANGGLGSDLRTGQEILIPSPDLLLPLPPVPDKRVRVSLAQQRLWAYANGQPLWEWPVSTGIPSSPTAPGVFQVQSHEEEAFASQWDLLMPRFMGIYRPGPNSPIMNGFHGFPKRGGNQILWTNSLGQPITFGCILLGTEESKLLYEWATAGTIVEVVP